MFLLPVLRKKPMEGLKLTIAQFTVLSLSAIILSIGLAALGYAGTFSRYLADDYCFSRLVIENGFWAAQVKSFTSWSDRFSTVFITDLIDFLGVQGIRFLPFILIILFLIGVVGTISRINRGLNLPLTGFEGYLLGVLITYSIFLTAPSQFQSLFWRAGSITYLLPLVILPYLGWMIFARVDGGKKWVMYAGIAFVSFINAGFSETTLALQLCLILLGLVLVNILRRNGELTEQSLVPIWIALIASLLAFGLMIASPGNVVRMDAMAKRPDLIKGAFLSVKFGISFMYHAILSTWLPMLVMTIFTFAIALQRDWKEVNLQQAKWLFWAIPAGMLTVIIACCAPSAMAQGAYPEDRALISAQWILVIGWVSWVYLLGMSWMHWQQAKKGFQLKQYFSNGLFVLVMLGFYFMFSVMVILSGIPALQQWATAWDARVTSIHQQKAAGATNLLVTPLDSVERIKELDDDPTHWVNKCAAVYYGVETIFAK
jgi:hypothetical protein